MASDWETVELQSVLEEGRSISYGVVQPGANVADGVPIVRVSDVRDGRINTTEPLRISPDIEANYSRTRLKGGELLLTLVGTVGETAVVPEQLQGWNTARAIGVIPVKRDVGAYWVRLALSLPEISHRIGGRVNTTVQITLNLRDVAQLPIILPPVAERKRIEQVIASLDKKIELNRKMNETLEAMARALFKSWFVDFDPVHAKAEGRPTGLPVDVADLFPDSFENSELGEIPKGWAVEPIGNLTEVIGGSTPSTKEPVYWNPEAHAWATPKDLSALKSPVLLRTERRISDSGLSQIGSGLLPAGTVLMSSRAPIGYLAIAEIPVAINQGFIAMKPKRKVSNLFLLYWAESAQETIKSRANGSTFLEISKSSFRQINVVRPSAEIMRKFDSILRAWYRQIVNHERQGEALATARDLLLPKLISGEIRIPLRPDGISRVAR